MKKEKKDGASQMKQYFRNKNGIIQIIFRESGEYLGERSSGCASVAEAKAKVPEILAQLQKEIAEEKARQPQILKPGVLSRPPFSPGSLGAELLIVIESLDCGWKDGTRAQYQAAADFIVAALGKVAYEPIRKVDLPKYKIVREELENDPGKKDSRRQFAGLVRRLTEELILRGLPATCRTAVKNIKGKSLAEAAGLPFDGEDIRRIHAELPNHPWVTHGLFWTGMSAGAQICDAAMLMLAEVDLLTGKVRSDRNKTGGIIEFVFLQAALNCFKSRVYTAESVFLFPELIYDEDERTAPGFKESADDVLDPKKLEVRIKSIRDRSIKIINKLLVAAGVKSKDKTYRSFRKELTSHLFSMNVPVTTLARIHGSLPGSIDRYAVPADWEFFRARDLRERRLQAVLAGKEERYFLSHTEVVEALEHCLKEEMVAMESRANSRHGEVMAMSCDNYLRIIELERKLDFLSDEIGRLSAALRLNLHPEDEFANPVITSRGVNGDVAYPSHIGDHRMFVPPCEIIRN